MPRKSRTRKRKNDSSTKPADDAVVQGAERAQTAEPDGSNIDPCNAPDPSTAESIDQSNAVCCWERSDSEQPSILGAVDSNTQLLEQLLAQVSDLREVVDNARHGSPAEQTDPSVGPPLADDSECDRLRDRIDELEIQVNELEQQNGDLASRVANSSVQQTVSDSNSSSSDALSWEERKQLILQQMEDDSFDAEAFVSSLSSESEAGSEAESPAEYLDQLHAELEKRDAEIARREEELQELRFVLEQQSETCEGNVAIGAAAIAEMIDSDELVQQERERLQLLQAEWEEKFRQGEIEASLERAKLSRERQELAKKQAELEEQLEHARRESRHANENGSASKRRWLVKLGLSDDA